MGRRTKGTGYIKCEGKSKTYYGYIRKGKKVIRVKLTTNRRESESLWTKYLTNTGSIKAVSVYGGKTPLDTAIEVAVHKMKTAGDSEGKIYRYRMVWRWVKEKSGEQYLEDLSADAIAKVLEGYGSSSKNKLISTIKMVFRLNGADLTPLKGFKRFHDKVEHHYALTKEEVDALLAVEGDDDMHDLVVLGLNSGLRLKDAIHLSKDQIHDGFIYATPYKTRRTAGTQCRIPVNGVLRGVLDKRRELHPKWFFPALVDEYGASPNFLTVKVRRFFGKAGIVGRLKMFHALRTTYITRLVEKGVPLGFIQTVVGHLDPATTMVYVKPSDEALKRWFE